MAQHPDLSTGELTSFVGRRQELADLRRLLSTTRLVTLTGIGGVGKSRLAFRLASDARRAFPDGVCVVELASLENTELLPHQVMQALEIREQSPRTPIDAICDHLRGQRMLLVMDSCEHVVAAASELVDRVLRAAPGVRVLATSRQPLRLSPEHVFTVSPLPVPGPGELVEPGTATQYASVALFTDRSAAMVSGFELRPENEAAVVRLCQLLEGIPLAIELAAVRLKVLSIDGLIERLDDRFVLLREGSRDLPERHRTLEAVVDWSHELCSPEEQELWARASVFSGGFTVDALEAVCSDDSLPVEKMLDTVAGLLDKSIIVREQHGSRVRFDMLETIRSYGLARLRSFGAESDLRRRHRDWCLGLLESAAGDWAGARQQDWADRLLLERSNLRHAFEWCVEEPGEARNAQRMVAVPWFWLSMGQYAEGRHWLDRVLALDDAPSLERSWAFLTAAYIAVAQGDTAPASRLIEQARDAAPDDPAAQAFAQHVLGVKAMLDGDLPASVALLTDALARYAGCDLPAQYAGLARMELATTYVFLEDVDAADALLDDVVQESEATGERWQLSYALWGRGYVGLLRGDLKRAEADVSDAIRIKREFQDTVGLALAIDLLAWITVASGDSHRAATLLGGTTVLWQSVGSTLIGSLHMIERRDRFETEARKAIGDAEFHAAFDRGASLTIDETIALALRERPQPAPVAAVGAAKVLTRREREVAVLVGEGLSNKEIAAKLVISVRTVEAHIEHILTKLQFTGRTQIAHWIAQQQQPQ